MKYLKWFILAIIDLLFNAICYLTNPFVLLFADEVGNLPAIFKWWSNWDDHLDVSWMVYGHHVPKFAEYDFNRHYKYIDEWQAEKTIGEHRAYVILLDPNFTLWERFQRYVCRLTWIYRNCAYGFSYYVTGIDVNGADVDVITDVRVSGNNQYYGRTKDAFCYYQMKRWTWGERKFILKLFFGWKFQRIKPTDRKHCMLALFAWPFK